MNLSTQLQRRSWLLVALLLPPQVVAQEEVGAASDLAGRVHDLEAEVRLLRAERQDSSSIDLTYQEGALGQQQSNSHVLARPWWENVSVSGFSAFGFLDSGNAGTRPNGGFLVKEASLFVEAEAWEGTSFFLELQTNRLAKDDSVFVRTGEVYARFDDLCGHGVGVKLGRVDLPFGEEYLWQDASDNPFITQSAAYPYGYDEGVVLYGRFGESSSWVASLTDGTDARSIEDNPAKAVTVKVATEATEDLYLSASAMANGDAGKSAFEFGGSHFQPVGAGGTSTLGSSTSSEVDAHIAQLDVVFTASDDAEISAFVGHGAVDDADSAFDRDLMWFMVQPKVQLSPTWFAALRFSQIGTTDSSEGYHFDGKTLAGGNSALGYDTHRLQRVAVAVGYQPNPHTLIKMEVGEDEFTLIDVSPLATGNDDRTYFGFEVVLSF